MREQAQKRLAKDPAEDIERYEYPECADAPFVPSWNGWEDSPDASRTGVRHDDAHGGPALQRGAAAELERPPGEEMRRAFEAGRARGVEEGREAERAAGAAARAAAREEQIRLAAEMAAKFGRERAAYFQAAEQEVVKLALAVAARILRREAQTDPLLLMGAVRVALGQLAASTEVRLRVPPQDLDLWTEAIALLPKPGAKPVVAPGEGMRLGECALETSLGDADLSIAGQLAEIERIFLAQREGDKADGSASPHSAELPSALEVSG